MDYNIEFSCFCGTGLIRKNNQDNFWYRGHFLPENHDDYEDPGAVVSAATRPVFCVFDGMGGEACGEKASFLCADAMDKISREPRPADSAVFFEQACLRMNDTVAATARALQVGIAGSTMTGIAFDENEITVCNVGDSRIYRYADGELKQLSKDHVMEVVPGRKPHLLQFIGVPPQEFRISPYIRKKEIRPGDIYLLCSDGVTDMMPEEMIAEVLRRGHDMTISARMINKLSLRMGGKDNLTGILCRIGDGRTNQ